MIHRGSVLSPWPDWKKLSRVKLRDVELIEDGCKPHLQQT